MKERKVILITGGSSGIGYEGAVLLASRGHKVYAAARRLDRMEPLKQYGIVPVSLDVTDPSSIKDCVKTVLDREGKIDVLVNNAGFGYFGPVETVSMEEARRQLEVNVFGLAQMCREVLPSMRKRGSGRIVNISSVAGKTVLLYGGWYHVSKYSVEAFSDALRMEMKPFGVDVVMIEPGAIATSWGIIAAEHLEESARGTAYEESAFREASIFRKAYGGNMLSSPSVIAKVIVRASESSCPKARYRRGMGSGMMLFLHWLLPAKWWDALVRRVCRIDL